MENNNEEILTALEEFSRLPPSGTISTLLEQYLSKVAGNGITLFPWCKLKPLLRHKLHIVLKDFQERSPMDSQAPCPNVENVKFDEMLQRLLITLDQFTGTPFTIQRLCELLTNPTKHYKKTDKFMRGIEKNLAVVTTVDSFGNRIVNESKSFVNGLDPVDVERSSTPDLFGTNVSVSGGGEHFDSPYIPSVPMNSPATSVWFSGMSQVANSPSSYPTWQQDQVAAGERCGTLSDSAMWAPYDGDGPSPSKRMFLQDAEPKKDADDLAPMVSAAPLLGELLNASEDASDNLTNGHSVQSDVEVPLSSTNELDIADSIESDKHSDGVSVSNSEEPTVPCEDAISPVIERPVVEPAIDSELTSTLGVVDTVPNTLDMSLDVSLTVAEDSEACCILKATDIEESKLSVDAGQLSSDCVSAVDCDSTANSADDVGLSNSVNSVENLNGLVTTNEDATLASDALPMDTE